MFKTLKMKIKYIILGLAVITALGISSCGDAEKKSENESTSEVVIDTEEDMEEVQAEFENDSVAKVYEGYLELKDALVQTDASAAAEAASNLQSKLNAMGSEVATIAEAIATSDDVNIQREKFSELTAAMDSLLKNAISGGKIFKQYCPMAFEGKGDYWYSSSEKIRNPYYGDKMLKCGRVEGTIQ